MSRFLEAVAEIVWRQFCQDATFGAERTAGL